MNDAKKPSKQAIEIAMLFKKAISYVKGGVNKMRGSESKEKQSMSETKTMEKK